MSVFFGINKEVLPLKVSSALHQYDYRIRCRKPAVFLMIPIRGSGMGPFITNDASGPKRTIDFQNNGHATWFSSQSSIG